MNRRAIVANGDAAVPSPSSDPFSATLMAEPNVAATTGARATACR